MAGLNRVVLVGNLGGDPEVRSTSSGSAVANFSLATSESWKDKGTGEWREQTEWHRVVCFGFAAESVARRCQKGTSVLVEGSLMTEKWTDDAGVDRWTTKVKAHRVQAIRGWVGDEERPAAAPAESGGAAAEDEDEDLPF